jgi:hypothetical protein
MSVRVVASVTSAEEVLLEALATLEAAVAAVAEVAAATSAVAEEGVAVTGVMIVVAVAVGGVTEEIAAGIEASAAAATMMTLAGES